jgi:hypothetical protein
MLKLAAQTMRETGHHRLHTDAEAALAQMRAAAARVLALLPEGRK